MRGRWAVRARDQLYAAAAYVNVGELKVNLLANPPSRPQLVGSAALDANANSNESYTPQRFRGALHVDRRRRLGRSARSACASPPDLARCVTSRSISSTRKSQDHSTSLSTTRLPVGQMAMKVEGSHRRSRSLAERLGSTLASSTPFASSIDSSIAPIVRQPPVRRVRFEHRTPRRRLAAPPAPRRRARSIVPGDATTRVVGVRSVGRSFRSVTRSIVRPLTLSRAPSAVSRRAPSPSSNVVLRATSRVEATSPARVATESAEERSHRQRLIVRRARAAFAVAFAICVVRARVHTQSTSALGERGGEARLARGVGVVPSRNRAAGAADDAAVRAGLAVVVVGVRDGDRNTRVLVDAPEGRRRSVRRGLRSAGSLDDATPRVRAGSAWVERPKSRGSSPASSSSTR